MIHSRSFPALAVAFGLALGLAFGAAPFALAQDKSNDKGKDAPPAADAAWAQLSERAKPAKEAGPAKDWKGVALEAKEFRTKYPDHPQSRVAEKIEVVATIRDEDARPELSTAAVQGATRYLGDKANPVRDRVEVKIAFEQAKLRRRTFASFGDQHAAKVAHARDMIAEFPGEPEGYGYQLSLAKGAGPASARQLAQELIAGGAPASYKDGARRVVARLDLEGRPFSFDAARAAVADAKDFTLVVYSWRTKDRGFLDLVKRHARRADVRFIGVNLDEDVAAARALASQLQLPGTQVYDGRGLDGPAATQLCLTAGASLYIVDHLARLRFVDGHRDTDAKLTQLALEKGFKL